MRNWLNKMAGIGRIIFACNIAVAICFTGCRPVADNRSDLQRRLNVLFIAVDDLNDWIEVLDSTAPIKTPNLVRLASRGMLFTKAYCSSPACNPSRASLLTGIMPSTSGVYGNRTDWRGALPDAVTIPQQFKANGYSTMGAGKIFHHHLGGAFHDTASFEDFLPMPDPPDYPMPQEKLNHLDWFGTPNSDWGIWPVNADSHVDVKTADYVISQLDKQHVKPFFLAAGIFRPHMPFFAPAMYFDMYPPEKTVMPPLLPDDWSDLPKGAGDIVKNTKWMFDGIRKADRDRAGSYQEAVRAYQACATFADAQVGRMLDALERSPYNDRTIIILWSDHGYHLGEKDHWEKFALWEKTTHVPLLVVAPGVTKPGSVCDQPVSLLDIYPTLADLCGLPENHALEGTSLLPLLRDPQEKREQPAIMTYMQNNHAIRSDQWRYIRYADGTEELYDLSKDPHEWVNIAGDPANRSVIGRLSEWLPSVNTAGYANLDVENTKMKRRNDE